MKTIERNIEMQSEYNFDYTKAKKNRFATEFNQSTLYIGIDKELSKYFTDEESVNNALRNYINEHPSEYKAD